jgi:hypothetical protein
MLHNPSALFSVFLAYCFGGARCVRRPHKCAYISKEPLTCCIFEVSGWFRTLSGEATFGL